MPSLLNLPAELRTQVYEYTLLFTDKCIIESSDEIEVFGGSVEDMHERLKQPAFTKVCRQVRAETLPIYESERARTMLGNYQKAIPSLSLDLTLPKLGAAQIAALDMSIRYRDGVLEGVWLAMKPRIQLIGSEFSENHLQRVLALK